jgi:hypothetical protein
MKVVCCFGNEKRSHRELGVKLTDTKYFDLSAESENNLEIINR